MTKQVWVLLAGLVTGMVFGFLAATAGAGAAMREMTRDRDEMRDRLTDSMNQLMDTAAASLQTERQKVTDLTEQLERRKPKKVAKGGNSG